MKIYFNREPILNQPWGGGNKFIKSLAHALTTIGHQIVFGQVLDKDIDLLICFDPRLSNYGITYNDLLRHKRLYNSKILQRVGDLGTHSKPELTELVNFSIIRSNFIVFPSEWAKDYIKFNSDNVKVIHNAPQDTFYEHRNTSTTLHTPISLVSHHWSDNRLKGFDTYKQLDNNLSTQVNMTFSYIGRKPDNINLKHSYMPLYGDELAACLADNDIYITASELEAGANHPLEAMACGLPVIYHKNSGSTLEYCSAINKLCFNTLDELKELVDVVINNYAAYKNNVLQYNRTINDAVTEYIKLINEITC